LSWTTARPAPPDAGYGECGVPMKHSDGLFHRSFAPTLSAASLCCMLLAVAWGHDAANASETCVKDARAALQADSPRAFGSGAIIEGPKTITTVEHEELAKLEECPHCPLMPFGYQFPAWEQFKRLVRPDDCLMFFRSSPYSWEHAFGSEGYVLVRAGRIVEILPTKIQ